MKPNELVDSSIEELRHKETDLREELFNLRFQHSTGQLENTMRIPQVKKDIARILTIIKSKSKE
ncbi:MAG: 50S ribosomal protein L29 [Thermodesulfobacteriota bacterium]|nr:50S ribosomal protein L29 [Thermodesulfobacteriota bacterium]